MMERRFGLVLQFRRNALGQNFAEFDAPLIERIDVPDHALCEYGMFVERNKLSQYSWREAFRENQVRRTVAVKNPMRDEPIGSSFSLDLGGSLAEGKRLSLSEDVRDQKIMMA